MTMPTPVAEFVDVAKTYRSAWRRRPAVQALGGISFTVAAGEVLGAGRPQPGRQNDPGENPAGPVPCRAAGRVLRLGRPLSERSTLARVGYMHENQAFPDYLTAAALLDYYGDLSRLEPWVRKSRVPVLLEKVGLADRAHEPIARFSKGMIQRLALAQALLTEPDLLVLDEPMEGLDMGGRRACSRKPLASSGARQDRADRFARPGRGRPDLRPPGCAGRRPTRLSGALADLLRNPDTGGTRSLEAALRPIYGEGKT